MIDLSIPDPGDDQIAFIAVRRVNGKIHVCRTEAAKVLMEREKLDSVAGVIFSDLWELMRLEPPR